jgi:hypothetical protein
VNESKFFCVWNYSRGLPRVRHTTKEKAQAEASRLAVANPGERFYVLSAFEFYSTQPLVNRVALAETNDNDCAPF